MAPSLPRAVVPTCSEWRDATVLAPLRLADGSGEARWRTVVRLRWDPIALHVRFECEDRDAWGTYTHRDEPIWEEEAVEVFLAPGGSTPSSYFELEVSPSGVLFDAQVENPGSRRTDMRVDRSWDCPGLEWSSGALGLHEDWWASLSIPWAAIAPAGALPRTWRANFYRIERPRGGEAELSAWSPTLADPPDFHKPDRFGRLLLAPPPGGGTGARPAGTR
jgi:Carbohydrate-binding family 9